MNPMNRSALYWALLVLCMAFFMVEIVYEVAEHWDQGFKGNYMQLIHLVFEVLSVIFLIFAFQISWKYQIALRRFAEFEHRTLAALREKFDDLITARFDEWELTSSERDVALLSFRGMKTTEIAAARGTRVGTVKAQLSSVFHKAGVTTKSEFLAMFMDAFLDLAAGDKAEDGWSGDLTADIETQRGPDGDDAFRTV